MMATGDIPKDYKAELTTPTKAQIEAAVWEVLTEWRAEMHDNVKHSLARRIAERIGHFIDRPTAALTASAGVPEQEHIPQKPGQKPDLLPNGNTAAEEQSELKRQALNEVIEQVEATTIERCAQELDRLMMRAAAAAVRALKDKP